MTEQQQQQDNRYDEEMKILAQSLLTKGQNASTGFKSRNYNKALTSMGDARSNGSGGAITSGGINNVVSTIESIKTTRQSIPHNTVNNMSNYKKT